MDLGTTTMGEKKVDTVSAPANNGSADSTAPLLKEKAAQELKTVALKGGGDAADPTAKPPPTTATVVATGDDKSRDRSKADATEDKMPSSSPSTSGPSSTTTPEKKAHAGNEDVLNRLTSLESGTVKADQGTAAEKDVAKVESKTEKTPIKHQNGMDLLPSGDDAAEKATKVDCGDAKPSSGVSNGGDAKEDVVDSSSVGTSLNSQPEESMDQKMPVEVKETASTAEKQPMVGSGPVTSDAGKGPMEKVAESTDKSTDVSGAPVAPAGSGPSAQTVENMETDKPPSVEGMDVDEVQDVVDEKMQPQQPSVAEASLDATTKELPDIEPNSQPESETAKAGATSSEISSSGMVAQSMDDEDNSKVSSSDEKTAANLGKDVTSSDIAAVVAETKEDINISGSVTASAEPEEAMEVDEDVIESTSAPVVEIPCVKKVAYQCTKDENNGTKKVQEPEPEKKNEQDKQTDTKAVQEKQVDKEKQTIKAKEKEDKNEQRKEPDEKTNVPGKSPLKKPETTKENTSNILLPDRMEVDSGAKVPVVRLVQIAGSVECPVPSKILADSSITTEHKKTLNDSSKVKELEDSIAESSLPSSSSDHNLADRLRKNMASDRSSTPNAAVSSSCLLAQTPNPLANFSPKLAHSPSSPSESNVRETTDEDAQSSNVSIGDEKHSTVVASTSSSTISNTTTTESQEKEKVRQAVKKEEIGGIKSDTSEVDSCTAVSMSTAEEINLYTSNARKFNGISSTSGSELDDKKNIPTVITTPTALPSTTSQLDLSTALKAEDSQYEVSVWFEGADLQFLSVERVADNKLAASATILTAEASSLDVTPIDSSRQSSNGSVSSIGPFALPAQKGTNTDSAMSQSSATDSSLTIGHQSKATLNQPKMKQTVTGGRALCDLIIGEFKKIRKNLGYEDDLEDDTEAQADDALVTPKGRGKKDTKRGSSARGQKRSQSKNPESDDEDGASPKGGKQAKRLKFTESPSAGSPKPTVTIQPPPVEQKQFAICCLARWSDRKYYAGRVMNYKGNKFIVVFEDGCSKPLSRELIVFGENDVLPILGHLIHGLTGGDTYEPGIVLEIKRNDANEVIYKVQIDSGVIEVTATEIYLTDEQARWIHNAGKDKPDPVQKLLEEAQLVSGGMQSLAAAGKSGESGTAVAGDGGSVDGSSDKGSRSTRAKRSATVEKTPVTPEAGYSGGVGKKGRRGRRLS